MLKRLQVLFDKEKDGAGAGGGSGYEETSPKPGEGAPPSETPSKNPPQSQAAGNNDDDLDDLGYKKSKAPEGGEKDKKAREKKDDEKVETPPPASGYGVDDPPPKDEKKDPPVTPPKDENDPYKDVKIEGLEDAEAKRLKEFAKANSLSKEAAQALVEQRKLDIKAVKDADTDRVQKLKEQVQNTKSQWRKELKEDLNFGGKNFALNIGKAEKVLDLMSATKKELTTRGSMLPPYVMRDLVKLHDQLFGTEEFVQGEAGASEKPNEEDSDLDDYGYKKQK